ncbi:hypothetical protein P3X46_030747 [Hevea brasiliensis]|uniref:Pectinesterase n=1 Tax=Hevea brasiliensis TaxID=3981 RepID=A0ABQ9KJP4_HEVBR|nr:putative pectinesterase 63 [Hevea brasiliensis]KAJ9140060.1 hypothetical protein P3X46_030747 [Hevea brasiliensis]
MANILDFLALAQYTILAIVLAAITVTADDATPIPDTPDGIQAWFDANIKPLADRAGTLEKALEAAEATPKTIKVRADGSGEFKTITDAVKSIPTGNKERVIVDIGPGTYTEKVTIERDKPFITFLGPPDKATLAFGGTAAEYGTVYSATLQVDSDFFVASNLIIQNTAPRPDGKRAGAQAVAFRIGGNMAAFYNVKMLGFQDTLCDDKGFHFFKDCYIEGTVDFIFGSGKSIYLQTEIRVLADAEQTVITAQARETEAQDVGYCFVHCSITGTGTGALLGRAWMPMPRVVFAYTSMAEVINPEGWSSNNHPEREAQVFFGEYKNTGPGAAPAGRVKYAKQLTEEEVKPFLSLGFIKGTSWLLPPPKA